MEKEKSRDAAIRGMKKGEMLQFRSSKRSAIYTSIYRAKDFFAPLVVEYEMINNRKTGILTLKRVL